MSIEELVKEKDGLRYCSSCKKWKSIEEFLKNKRSFRCLACNKKYHSRYRKTINGLIQYIYQSHKRIAAGQGLRVLYSLEDFMKWVNKQDQFFKFYRMWSESGLRGERPRVIKRHPGDYTLDNLRVTTLRGVYDSKKVQGAVKVTAFKEGQQPITFISIREAATYLNRSTRALNIALINNWNCGGHRVMHATDFKLSLKMPAPVQDH